MLLKKSNKLIKLIVLSIVSTLSLISTANAGGTIDFTVENDTDFDVYVPKVQGVILDRWEKQENRKKSDTQSARMQPIPSGESVTMSTLSFAPGINKIAWAWITDPTNWQMTTNDYQQTKATLIFAKEGVKVEKSIEISQDFVGKDQTLTFDYDKQEVKINVSIESEENIWYGAWIEMYYDYTITLTQAEPARGTLK